MIKSFKEYLREQTVPEDTSTSDPNFVERKAKRDTALAAKEQKKSEQVTKDAEISSSDITQATKE